MERATGNGEWKERVETATGNGAGYSPSRGFDGFVRARTASGDGMTASPCCAPPYLITISLLPSLFPFAVSTRRFRSPFPMLVDLADRIGVNYRRHDSSARGRRRGRAVRVQLPGAAGGANCKRQRYEFPVVRYSFSSD
jgi:hypothetical protein